MSPRRKSLLACFVFLLARSHALWAVELDLDGRPLCEMTPLENFCRIIGNICRSPLALVFFPALALGAAGAVVFVFRIRRHRRRQEAQRNRQPLQQPDRDATQ